MKKYFSILIIAVVSTFMISCRENKPITQDLSASIANSDGDFHTTLSSGLSIDSYELEGPPGMEPLTFNPVSDYLQEELLSIHQEDRSQGFPDNSFFDMMTFGRRAEFGKGEIIAIERSSIPENPEPESMASMQIDVKIDDEILYSASAGDMIILPPLKGLWTYNQSWALEYAMGTMTLDKSANTATSTAIGQLVVDGVLINERDSFDEIFGFQLMHEKPFYFFEKDGQIGISYDDEVIMLGYEEIPHYACCSPAMLNPRHTQNMVSFFAMKNDTWYYVEVGVYQ
ncbi:MAG: hypothetical protein JEZ06_11085 [Anaerolineaceae bacterium]|nr:hypothetical protein [Anaerolineaceae bacterium]